MICPPGGLEKGLTGRRYANLTQLTALCLPPAETDIPCPDGNRYPAAGVVCGRAELCRLVVDGCGWLRDTAQATAKSVAGIGLPTASQRTTRASVFFCVRPSSTRNLSYDGLGRSSFGGAGSL